MDTLSRAFKWLRRVVVLAVGTLVLLLGVLMVVAPGPAFIFIPAGLAILSMEFTWARAWLKKLRQRLSAKSSRKRAVRAALHRERRTGI